MALMNMKSSELSTFDPPQSADELLRRAQALEGKTLSELSTMLDIPVVENLFHNKGWMGQTLEKLLGASAGSNPEPDFPQLGIELKTIPVMPDLKPFESTYVCKVSLVNPPGLTWETSLVHRKLSHVLWVPIVKPHRKTVPAACQIGAAFLWQPNDTQQQTLRQDWEELMDMVCFGELERITAHLGTHLQIRPKGANARDLCEAYDETGGVIETMARGFYLRSEFTASLLKEHLERVN